jgi:uncharacterized protein YciI
VIRNRGPRWNLSCGLRQQEAWDAHADFIDALVSDGVIESAGPLTEGSAMIVLRAESQAAAQALLAADPWVELGLFVDDEPLEWTVLTRQDVGYQLVVDAIDPSEMATFWSAALGYELQQPPPGFDGWGANWRSVGVPEDECNDGYDSIVDPRRVRPRIWFQRVPEAKSIKNRLHIDISVGGGRGVPIAIRAERIETEAARLAALGASRVGALVEDGVDHYAVAMRDPEGNEFDIN